MLAGNTSSEGRALIYGYLASDPGAPIQYEWATIPSGSTVPPGPSGLTFSPEAVVTVCDNDLSASAMILTEAVGVLSIRQHRSLQYAPVPDRAPDGLGSESSRRAARPDAGRRRYARAPSRHCASRRDRRHHVKDPEEHRAEAYGLGGRPRPSWANKPPATINGTAPNTFAASVNVNAAGNAILGVCAYMIGKTNNGTPTQLVGPKHADCASPPGGGTDYLSVLVQNTGSTTASLADFGQVGITKTGGIDLTVTVQVQGRAGTGSITTRSNVKPKK